MTPERLGKARATRQANSERFASQIITVNDDWQIIRADELNWEIQHKVEDVETGKRKWKFFGYYGSIVSALQALPAKMLGSVAKGTLADLQRLLLGISEEVKDAARRADFNQ